jgi:3-hydroxyacyl-CoA dehydrogenase/enoyl-CoA hydratase/3-hydroxybutyryl-CoA epimerase
MVEGALVDFDTAMRIESRYLAGLMTSSVARNMINTVFFNMNSIKSGHSRPAGVPRYLPQKVGILGAGLMGSGIAYSQASRGIASVLKDLTLEKAEKGKAYSAVLSQKLVEKGRMTAEQQSSMLSLIQATDNVQDLKGCNLIIEAVFERRDLKAAVTKETQTLLAEGGFFASNTSTLPISGLATASHHPEKFIGIHFFSPVEKMKLVEIIRGEKTDDETIARAYDYVQALGKLPIVVNDSRGFYTSRTFATFVMEGAAMLGEGIPAPVIENLAMQVGMPVGPLAVIDETALTLSVHVLEQTREDFKNEGRTYAESPGELLVERMVKEFKRGGRASGGGFYDYPAGQKKMLWPELKKMFEKSQVTLDMQDIKDRILYRQAIETARCLDEGVLTSIHEGNIGSIFGIGYPAWTGGALQFIYGMGVSNFAKRSQELAAQYGDGFNVSKGVLETLEKYKPVY